MDAPVGSKAALRRMLSRAILTLRKIVSSLLLMIIIWVSDLLVRLVVLVLLVVLVDLQHPHLVAVHGDAALAIEVDDYIYNVAHVCALEVE